MSAVHTEARYTNEEAARKHLESIRWPDGPVCPHCGGIERNSKLNGESHRVGLYFCGDCRQQFTVTVGTLFEDSKVPLHKWLYATHLMCASKKGISSKQLERVLGVSYKTAWFMSHRLREAMNSGSGGPLGGNGTPVEVDETYWGNVGKQAPGARGWAHKMKVVSLIRSNQALPYSSAVSMAPSTVSANSICSAMRRSLTFAGIIASSSASTMPSAPTLR